MKDYAQLLAEAPAHDTPEFIEYLKQNNKVVAENDAWIVIENFKYHTPERPWLTAFYKPVAQHSALKAMSWVGYMFMDWTWLKKNADTQSVKRFHIHLIQGEI